MAIKALLLRTMLGALVLAAGCGVAAMLLADSGTLLRLMGSAFTVVAACGLLLPVSASDAGAGLSRLQTAWTVFIGVSALTVVALIQLPFHSDALSRFAFGWLICGSPSMLVAWAPLRALADKPLPGRAGPAALVGTGAAFAASMTVMLVPSSGLDPAGFALTLYACLQVGTVLSACALTGLRAPSTGTLDRSLAIAGTIASVSGALLASFVTWHLANPWWGAGSASAPDWTVKCMAVVSALGSLGLSAAVWNLLGIEPLPGATRWLRHVATACSASIGVMLTQIMLQERSGAWNGDLFGRCLGALIVVDASALLAAAVLMRASRLRRATASDASPLHEMPLRCPRCQRHFTACLGETACSGCGLVVLLDFRDDRCPACRYDLRGAPGTSCPECGRARQMPRAGA